MKDLVVLLHRYWHGTELTDVIDANDLPLLRRFLSSRLYPVDEYDTIGVTPLFYATYSHHFACIAELLKAGADVKQKMKYHLETPLEKAITHEHYAAIPLFWYWREKPITFLKPYTDDIRWRSTNKFLRDVDDEMCQWMEKFQKMFPRLRQLQQEAESKIHEPDPERLKPVLEQYEKIAECLYEVVCYEQWLYNQYCSQDILKKTPRLKADFILSCQEGHTYFAIETLKYYVVLAQNMDLFLELKAGSIEAPLADVREALWNRIEELCGYVLDDKLLDEQQTEVYQEARCLLRERPSAYHIDEMPSMFSQSRSSSGTSSRSHVSTSGSETEAYREDVPLAPVGTPTVREDGLTQRHVTSRL